MQHKPLALFQDSIHKLSMARLDSGDASLVVQHSGETPFTIEGRIYGVSDELKLFARNDSRFCISTARLMSSCWINSLDKNTSRPELKRMLELISFKILRSNCRALC